MNPCWLHFKNVCRLYHLCHSHPVPSHRLLLLDHCYILLPGLPASALAPLKSIPNTQADKSDHTLDWKSHFILNKSRRLHRAYSVPPNPCDPCDLICHRVPCLLTQLQSHWFPCCSLSSQSLCTALPSAWNTLLFRELHTLLPNLFHISAEMMPFQWLSDVQTSHSFPPHPAFPISYTALFFSIALFVVWHTAYVAHVFVSSLSPTRM